MNNTLEKLTEDDICRNKDLSLLCSVVGIENTKEVVSELGGTNLYIPKKETVVKPYNIRQIKENLNKENHVLARCLNLSERAVHSIKKEIYGGML